MPDIFDRYGLQVQSLSELLENLTNDILAIYPDATLSPDTQDGQILNIFAQGGADLREIILRINSSFDPDQAAGRILDQRVALNNLRRNGGTYTIAPVEVVTNASVTLVGLDTQVGELEPNVSNLYTLRDDEGNQFFLISSISLPTPGTHTLNFRAQRIGRTEVAPNSITTPVTINGAIDSVNNPAGPSSVGINEESDAELKIRRRRSTSAGAQAIIDAIEANILALDNVSFARVTENNDSSAPDGDGTPPNTIWVIVGGGDDNEIAQIIYTRKPPGPAMRGNQLVNITRPGIPPRVYPVRFDRPIDQNLYIRFALSLPGGNFDNTEIINSIVNNVFWSVGQTASGDVITAYLKSLNSQYVITQSEVSGDGTTFAETLAPTSAQHQFINSAARITIL